MDFATGAIGAVIQKLGSLLEDEYGLQKSVEGGIKLLMTELESMQAYLEKVSSVPEDQIDRNEKLWAREVRELSYDIDDRIDTFLVQVQGKKIETEHSITGFIIDWTRNLLSKVIIRHKLGADIKDIMARVKEAKERHDRYKANNSAVASATTKSVDPRLHALYKKATQLVGTDEKIVYLRDKLNKGGDEVSKEKLRSISIVGVGGLGKTTLAKAAYDKIKVEFECCAFVSVGQNPEVEKVLKDILLELDKQRYKDIHNLIRDEKQLIDLILEFLDNKRYIVVIDDIWDIQSWETIKLALVENNCGSRIMTTTRNIEVATEAGDVYELAPLSYDNSKKLLCTRIFGDEEKCPNNQLDEVVDKILKKCGGVPLAIITMASLLAGKPRGEWSEVFSSIGFGQTDSRHVDNTMRILSFSYYAMPFHLRTCLLYLSVFPEDYFIRKDLLIWMWIAEGFVQPVQGVGLFELGERYFNDLANTSMIQPNYWVDGSSGGCYVHDMVLALIRSLSCKENFVTVLDNERATPPCNNVRRLSLQNKALQRSSKSSHMDMTHVRSIIAFSCQIGNMVPLSSFKVLRVLVLENGGGFGNHDYRLMHLGHLVHLRYFRVRGISEVPKEIGALKFLQTLDLVDSSIKELPLSIGLLTQLVRLRFSSVVPCRFVEGTIGNLKSLEELWLHIYSDVNGKTAWRILSMELGNLMELRVLNIDLSIARDEDESFLDGSLECLRNLHKLRELSLYLPSSPHYCPSFMQQEEAPGFVLSRHLQCLILGGGCWFSHMPTRINSSLLPNLSLLVINVRSLNYTDMRILGRQPELRSLNLETDSNVLVCGGDGGGFLRLRSFSLRMSAAVMFRRDEYGAPPMPRLQNLYLDLDVEKWKHVCARHGQGVCFLSTVIGLHNISSLEKIYCSIDFQHATHREVQETEDALRQAASTHPNHPTFQIQRLTDPTTSNQEVQDEEPCKFFDFHVHVRELNDMDYAFDFKNLRDLPSVEQVSAHINCEDATPGEVEEADAALRHAVEAHPNHPTLQVETYAEDKMKRLQKRRRTYIQGHTIAPS